MIPTATCLLVTHHPGNHGDLVLGQLINVSLVALYVATMTTEPSLQAIHLTLDDVVPFLQVVQQLLLVGRDKGVELVVGADLLLQSICLEKPSGKES